MVTYTIDEYLKLRKSKSDFQNKHSKGVYMLINETKRKYYVGQSEEMSERAFVHLTGRGNGDVYLDYKLGDEFSVRFYELNTNQFIDLNELEYHLIRIYQANETGYNRQAGNRTRNYSSVC